MHVLRIVRTPSRLLGYSAIAMNTSGNIPWKKWKNLFETSYSALESVMESLTATDISVFLYTFFLADKVPIKAREKFMNIYRDMPNCKDWFEMLKKRGDTFIIAGEDINRLMGRYRDPANHWLPYRDEDNILVRDRRDDKCKVWGIGISSVSYAVMNGTPHAAPPGLVLDNHRDYGIGQSGEIVRMERDRACDSRSCEGRICDSVVPISNVVIPRPGRWPKCRMDTDPYSFSRNHGRIPVSESAIDVYFLDWIRGTHFTVDRHNFMEPIDVVGTFNDGYCLTYINMNTSELRHSLAAWDLDEYSDMYARISDSGTLSMVGPVNERCITVEYKPRDISSESCMFSILFE